MAAVPLPPALEDRLAALVTRVRRLRLISGTCRLAVALLVLTAALVALDAAFRLSTATRCVLQLGWLALAGLLAWWLVVRPWRADVTLGDVAKEIERRYPGLGERLVTVVTLRDEATLANGSPQLIASLAKETDLRTRSLDFGEAVPTRAVSRWAVVAGVVVLAALFAALLTPGTGDRFRRLALPWYKPAVVVPYRVLASSGNAVVKRGDPVTLSGYVERTVPSTPVPDAAVLTFRDGPGSPERRLPMTAAANAAFHVTRPNVAADFEYRVEVGPAASDWHTVFVADPAELADGTAVEITPPAYATMIPPRTISGFTEIGGLQYSAVVLRLRFDRPADAAFLEWRPEAGTAAELVPVQLAPDGTAGTATMRLKQSGTLKAVLVTGTGPRKFKTEVAVPVRVMADAPPRFEQVAGVGTQSRTIRPGERLPLGITATDDVAVAAAELEYAVGDPANPTRVPITLAGAGTGRAEGRFVFDLAGKGGEGETVRFRIRITDNRNLDDPKLGPQEAVYPPSGWAELKLSASAPPLDHQEVIGKRDSLEGLLKEVLREVKDATDAADRLRTDTDKLAPLAVDQAVRLTAIREKVKRAAELLRDASKETALTPELRPLAAALKDVADRQLKAADDALLKAATDKPEDRKPAFNTAVRQLVEAADKLEELLARNDRAARDRLDRRQLEALATDQTDLADKAKPSTKAPAAELAREQKALLDRLLKLLTESEPLKTGADAAGGREARQLAADAKALAALLRDLDAAAKQLTAETRGKLLEAIAKAQATVADRAAKVLPPAELPARLAGVTPPKPEDFRRVADLLTQDKLLDALTEFEKLALNLDRTAEAFEKAAIDRADAKLAAKQLAAWQDDLRARLVAATKTTRFDKLPEVTRAAFRTEEEAILAAATGLKLPADIGLKALHDSALGHIRQAAESLGFDGRFAEGAMKAAAEALTKLAEKTPSNAERLAKSRLELDKLRAEQESITVAAEQVTRGLDRVPDAALMQSFARKLAPTHERQQKLVGQLAALDLPGLEARQAKAGAALKAAAADLKDGLPYDITASQAWAKRELDRLKQATDNTPPADDKADELARKQADIAAGVAALGPTPTAKQLEPFATAQQDVFKQLERFLAPEVAALLNDAREAATAADAGFRNASKPDELRKRTKAAADTLAKLADRVAGRETDLERVRRLAANRKLAAEDARKHIGKPFNSDVSKAVSRQLVNEAEELAHTRVGAAGQAAKRKVLDAFARLAGKSEPDRLHTEMKALADALDELASKMTDVAELTTRPKDPPAPEANPADAFLPSKPLAEAVRELARQERGVRDAAAGLNTEAAMQLRPADTNPLAALEQKQRELVAGIAELTRSLLAEKEPGAAEGVAKTIEAARAAADRLRVGQPKAAKESGEAAAKQLRQLVPAAGAKPWAKAVEELAAKQDAVLAELKGLLDNPAAAAAMQKAGAEELAGKAGELARRLELAARNADPTGATGKALAEAAGMAKAAEKMLADAAKRPADADRLRAEADKMLRAAAERAAGAAGTPAATDPAALTAGDAIADATAAMRKAAGELAPKGDRSTAEAAMRQAADALNKAAKAAGGPQPPPPPTEGSPTAGTQSNGNTGVGSLPTTPGDLTPEQIENWGKNWGTLPGEVKAKVIQDARARFGDDYARVIKLYFEQLAERK